MKRIKKTKIIATLGPATSSVESIESLIKEGVDVLRINFSHSTHKEAEKMIREIREVNDLLSTNTAILADLQGPKLRIGQVSANTELKDGDNIFIKTGNEFRGDNKTLYLNYNNLYKDIKKGEKILIDDGKIILKVIDIDKKNQIIS